MYKLVRITGDVRERQEMNEYIIVTEYDDMETSSEPLTWDQVLRHLRKGPSYSVTGYRISRHTPLPPIRTLNDRDNNVQLGWQNSAYRDNR